MIQEEYKYEDVSDYLLKTNDLLIAGFPGEEERSNFFVDLWKSENKSILLLKSDDSLKIHYTYIENGDCKNGVKNLNNEIVNLLRQYNLQKKNILMDMSSLQHVLIMFLTKIMITSIKPATFFSSYIRPEKYMYNSEDVGFSLCDHVSGIDSVPGFVRRVSQNETLCSFLGFEGIRLKNILELSNNIKRFVPVVAFPTGSPQWYKVTMWNCMDIMQSGHYEYDIRKCDSESVYSAIEVLQNNLMDDEHVVLAPLGTRPHSMACAIFACQHRHARIIYDYVIESKNRTHGISDIKIYNITPFINVK